VIVTVPAILLAALLGPVLLPVVFGSAYEDSVVPFLWLLPGAIGLSALLLFSSALTASGAPGLSSLGPTLSLVIGTALDFALIPPFGATGAAVAASVGYLAGGVASLLWFRSVSPFALAAIVPRVSDLAAIRALAGQLVRRAAEGRAEGRPAGP
jgi:O-antigen/teichoic acid export membrane protein